MSITDIRVVLFIEGVRQLEDHVKVAIFIQVLRGCANGQGWRAGNPYENAMMESFYKTLKYEEVNLCAYEPYQDVVTRLPYFLEEVYIIRRDFTQPLVTYRQMNLRRHC